MTEENNRPIRYLNKQDIADIHADLSADVLRDGDEPLPEFRYARQHEIDALIAAPQQRFFGRENGSALARSSMAGCFGALASAGQVKIEWQCK